jgi:hypothetical protein
MPLGISGSLAANPDKLRCPRQIACRPGRDILGEHQKTGKLDYQGAIGRPWTKPGAPPSQRDWLGITLIPAHTPQAKGRVERLWGTLRDRHLVWLRLEGISDMDTASASLPRFIEAYNARFSVRSADAGSAFVPLTSGGGLDTLLCVRHERTTDNCDCFSLLFLLSELTLPCRFRQAAGKKKIQFLFNGGIGFLALYSNRYCLVSLPGWPGKGKTTQPFSVLPDVVKLPLQKTYYAGGRVNPVVA